MALPALNGAHAEDDPVGTETERVWATLPKELVKAIDDYHHEHRFRNRSAAVRHLIERGIAVVPFRGKNLT
jgi:hypothetical protein